MAPFVWLFYRQEYIWALKRPCGYSTDYFDGAVARSAPEKSTYGSWIDLIADAQVMSPYCCSSRGQAMYLRFCAWIGLRYLCFVVIMIEKKMRTHHQILYLE